MKTNYILLIALVGILGCRQESKLPDTTLASITKETDVPGIRRYDDNKIARMLFKYGDRFDGWAWAPKPDGFTLSPADADFIFTTLSGGVGFWRSNTRYLFYGSNSYYAASQWPASNRFESVWPMLDYATRINADDGTVYNRASNVWERAGCVYMSYTGIVNEIALGQAESDLAAHLGRPYARHDHGEGRQALEYWCRDGNFLVIIKDHVVVGIVTNVPWKRL